MIEAEQLLREILEHGGIVDRDIAGKFVIELAVDRAMLRRLMAFGADLAELRRRRGRRAVRSAAGASLLV